MSLRTDIIESGIIVIGGIGVLYLLSLGLLISVALLVILIYFRLLVIYIRFVERKKNVNHLIKNE